MTEGCSVGIMAHNEERNIGSLLAALVSSSVPTEIIVVASGCTDGTESITRSWRERDKRIHLIVQETREGKASAVNAFLRRAREKVVVLCSADLIPDHGTIERLLEPFADPEVGMTSARPVPVNDPATFMGFAAHLLWGLHHQLNLSGQFKAGELIAFRRIFERIPYRTAVDEASIEPVIRGQGYRAVYVSDATVRNKGPETLQDFLSQRRRIYAGHLEIRNTLGYQVNTMSGLKIFGLLLKQLDWRPRLFLWTWAIVALEVYGRVLGRRDCKQRRDHSVWRIADTTKNPETELSSVGERGSS